MRRANGAATAVWRSCRRGAAARWFTGEPPRRRVIRICVGGRPRRLTPGPTWHTPAMPTTTAERITDIGVRLFKAVENNYWYPFLSRRLDRKTSRVSTTATRKIRRWALPLVESDERNRFGIQLYHRVATQVDLNAKQVLEVSCGHGGGASYLLRTLHPASYTGLDFNPDGIAFCRKRHHLPGLDFVHGDAENLPFADESFDAVVNVEASHAYPRLPRFLAEVVRVLRPGGHLLYADFRGRTSSAAGTQHWPTPSCGRFRDASSIRRSCAGWRKTHSGQSN